MPFQYFNSRTVQSYLEKVAGPFDAAIMPPVEVNV